MSNSDASYHMAFTLADFTILLCLPDESVRFELEPEVRLLLSKGSQRPDLTLYIHYDHLPIHRLQDPITNPQGLHPKSQWAFSCYHDRKDGPRTILCFRRPKDKLPIYYGLIRLEAGFNKGYFYIDRSKLSFPDQFRLAQDLIIMLMAQILSKDIIFIHSCGVFDRESEQGMLFAGPNGAGKSTMAMLWKDKGAAILNEDQVIVRKIDRNFYCYNCPWSGRDDLMHDEKMPLNRIFLLKHSPKNVMVHLKRAEAVAQLFTLSRSISPAYNLSLSDNILKLFLYIEKITRHVPVYELAFAPDKRVVDFVQNGISGSLLR